MISTLPMLTLMFPNIDPVMVSFGPLAIRWYALSYVAGILLGWWLATRLNRVTPSAFSEPAMDNVMVWIVFGILLGGRIGYVLFYNAGYYLENLSEVYKPWHGGMSFHGGMIGVILAMFLMCKRYKLQFWPVIDIAAVVTPIGLGLGRIANFINGELYGRISNAPWAMVFPGDPFARHPSQLYEAFLEGLVLLFIMLFSFRSEKIRTKPGTLSGIFLVGYASFRAFVEFFREPDVQIGFIANAITMGQVLCIPMLLLGLYLILRDWPRRTA
ncbi:MAG: prolipoprotein diacylglyceryl transferase [Proteobacteria bacterium]|nr:prolipoprotein diacylglyceryl transferase [Pseudomonadota bacterium]